VWGSSDCCTLAADWVKEQRGVDPMAVYRGRYTTPLGAQRLLKQRPLATVIQEAMAAAKISETMVPKAGDLGLVQTDAGPVMSIFTGRGWIVKMKNGMACTMSFPAITIWSV
jgi:hypothetical protein